MQRVDNLNQEAIFHGWEIRCWNTMILNSHFASFSCLSENLKMAQTAGRMLQDFWEKPEVSFTYYYSFVHFFLFYNFNKRFLSWA